MPDQVVESSPKQVNPPDIVAPKEPETRTFKQVVHRVATIDGKTLDLYGGESTTFGASIDVNETFLNPEENPTVYFETSSGTIYKLTGEKDLNDKPTLRLLRSNRPSQPMWFDVTGKIKVGNSFDRMGYLAGTSDETSLETSHIKRIAVFKQSSNIPNPNAQQTDIVQKFERQFTTAGGILPQNNYIQSNL